MPRLTSLTTRIADAPRLTRSEAALAEFYETHLPGAALMGLPEVCAATGLSEATVSRFIRTLGYKGFRDMSRSLQAELVTSLDQPGDRLADRRGSDPDAATVLTDRFRKVAGALDATAADLEPEALDQAASLLADPERTVYLAAVASGRPLMEHFGLLARYLRPDVVILPGQDRWAHALADLQPGDVVLAEAFDRAPTAVRALLRIAGERGAVRVLLTNHVTPLVASCDVRLQVVTPSDDVFRSRLTMLAVLEVLLDLMTQRCPDALGHAARVEESFAALQEHLVIAGDALSAPSPARD